MDVPLFLILSKSKYGLYIRYPGFENFLEMVQDSLRKGNGRMKKDTAIKKNLDLLNEFMKYAFESPEILEKIPPESELVILPIGDQELYKYNEKMANKMFSQGKNVVLVKMKKPEISTPELELMMTGTA